MERVKYPRTPHLPWSCGTTRDDMMLRDVQHFIGEEVIVTEKMDGENTTLYNDGLHARSTESGDHLSRHWIKGFHAGIACNIPPTVRICGENLFAKHAIYYDKLPSYFLCFSIWHKDICLSWEMTKKMAGDMGLVLAPVLYEGIWDEEAIRKLYTGKSVYGSEQEGYVVRLADDFHYDNFGESVAKFVRPNHVLSTTHNWMRSAITKNSLG